MHFIFVKEFNQLHEYLSEFKRLKFYFIYAIVGSVFFLSQIIFNYDEEKVIALCLISFSFIFYINLSSTVYSALSQKALTLEKEFLILFKEKNVMMWKLRRYWRLFLDLDDFTIDVFKWLHLRMYKVSKTRFINRSTIYLNLLKVKYQLILINKFSSNKNLNLLLLNLFKENLFKNKKVNKVNYVETLNTLVLNKFSLKYLILCKLNIFSFNNLNYKYKSHYYYLF